MQMSKKVLALSVVLLLSIISLASISFVKAAGDAEWITSYTVTDANTGSILLDREALSLAANKLSVRCKFLAR